MLVANLLEEINVDTATHKENCDDLEEKLRNSQSYLDQSGSVDQLTQQIMKRHEVVNTWQEAQDFRTLETVSSAVSIHVIGQQNCFRVLVSRFAAQGATKLPLRI